MNLHFFTAPFSFWGQVCYNEEHIKRGILLAGEQTAILLPADPAGLIDKKDRSSDRFHRNE